MVVITLTVFNVTLRWEQLNAMCSMSHRYRYKNVYTNIYGMSLQLVEQQLSGVTTHISEWRDQTRTVVFINLW